MIFFSILNATIILITILAFFFFVLDEHRPRLGPFLQWTAFIAIVNLILCGAVALTLEMYHVKVQVSTTTQVRR